MQLLVADNGKLKPLSVARVRHCCPLSLEVDIIIDFHFVALVGCLVARLECGRNSVRFPLFTFLYGLHELFQLSNDVLAVCGILNIPPSLALLNLAFLD
jgi:hypothetical protein